jgi:hypothetical protein
MTKTAATMFGWGRVRPAVLLFASLGSAVAWATHFCAVYFIDTLFCTEGWSGGDVVIYIATMPFAVAAAASGLIARRAQRGLDDAADGAGEDAQVGAERALLRLGVPSAVLFTLLIVAAAFAPAFVAGCAATP